MTPEPHQSPTPRTAIQAIDRSVALLDAIADAGPTGVPLSELAETTGLATSTARTLLSSLVEHGLVAQGGRRRYLLGARFFELNRRFVTQTDLSAVAAPVLRALWERTEETVHLAVLQGLRRVDIAVLVGPQLLTVSPTSARFTDATSTPLYRTAAGKMLFSGLDRASRLAMLAEAPWDSRGRPGEDELMAAMDDVAAQGYATNVEEEMAGVCGVAAPVQDQAGRTVAAVCLGYPAVRHTDAHATWLREEAVGAAAELTLLLGGDGGARG
ncbi:IclR family transcriptional regulator [Desertihabitans brevis]|uniref:IclR family transcriptional regulator n=1 Tax=Desertihabitans brevis TaxID=2268447 RepID=A0A367YSH4_9ACTN|nr:IclR family transcriptional regulator [Desertihabitans brevis]RCK68750.1 IclR family transcriptional regulator [Desertihabitans brevis]